ncbi:MAG: hypothetical protein M3R47_11795 [Chloroflexota bacterium]|nr:hypothetical protein [Chloroflexota bacterium]
MKKLPGSLLKIWIGLLMLTACSSSSESIVPVTATVPPQPTATQVKVLPTPASPGDSITWRDLQVIIGQLEITDEFITEFGSTRKPSPGKNFMWAHIQLKNVGQIEIEIPQIEHFSVLYAALELKPTYGHRQAYTDYSTLGPILFPGDEADGWIRFDIPATAELKDMLCVFIPESAQIGSTFSSPNYPYSEDKPTYVWKCAP